MIILYLRYFLNKSSFIFLQRDVTLAKMFINVIIIMILNKSKYKKIIQINFKILNLSIFYFAKINKWIF